MLNFATFASSRTLALSLLGLLMVSWGASRASADAASGTYTGAVGLRGNYYWENSTRVVAPNATVNLDTPSGVRVDGSYLLDAITSASQATGVVTDNAFTEKRNEAQVGVGYEFDLGKQQLDVSVRGRFSKEPDYLSRGAGFGAALNLNERNTVFRLSGYFVHDDVYRRVRMASAEDPTRLSVSSADPVGQLDVLSIGLAWDQVIDRSLTLTVGYDLAVLTGFQANAYRQVAFANGGAGAEKHPTSRARSAGYVWLSYFSEVTRTAIRGGYRLYYDNWDVLAHVPELRIHQEIGPHLEVRLRYRYYTQSSSFFYRQGGNLRSDRFYTFDPKMTEFHNQTLGLKVRLTLDFLGFTKLDFLKNAVLDWTVEYIANTNRYGNGIVAQGGLLLPF